MTEIEGVDYSTARPDPAALYAAGKRFAMRYVGPGSSPKHLTRQERDALHAAGLAIVLLAEGTTTAPLDGWNTGQTHARQAASAAVALALPPLPIYFAVDFEVTTLQWPMVREYLRGAASIIGADRVGIYGGLHAMQWAARDGVAAWFFQTYAWSFGRWFGSNHVEQYRNHVTIAGGQVDLCRAVRPNYGQWPQTEEAPDMTPAQATMLEAMAWRTEAIIQNLAVVRDGPTKGERNELHFASPVPVTVDADAVAAALASNTAFLAAIAKADADEDHRRSAE